MAVAGAELLEEWRLLGDILRGSAKLEVWDNLR